MRTSFGLSDTRTQSGLPTLLIQSQSNYHLNLTRTPLEQTVRFSGDNLPPRLSGGVQLCRRRIRPEIAGPPIVLVTAFTSVFVGLVIRRSSECFIAQNSNGHRLGFEQGPGRIASPET